MQTMAEHSEFVPVPVIGARTAGLSYIDPSIKINTNNFKLQFPATHNFEVEQDKIEENKEEEVNGQNSLLQSQASLMMHSVRDSIMTTDKLRESTTTLGDVQHDIAMMDAQSKPGSIY
eukprot:TRINITY_DN6129_c0_g1_i2.p1 TRINITY_DN6129_c0_g1~~TRINITY_DN6129_c0_g1_i2.p1  ORF type:complete len:118 (-),score=12.87 TRINITY_DN6129_c0_g1_i2:224-577(-)